MPPAPAPEPLSWTPATAQEVAHLDARAFRADLRYPAEEYARRLAEPGSALRGIRVDGRLVAVSLTAPDRGDPEALFLDVMAVDPDARGKGHGRRLVEDALDRARREGFRRVTLLCEARDATGGDLVAFYRHHGFDVVADLGDHYRMRATL